MFTLRIDTDNAAFGDNPRGEIARILRHVAGKLEGFDHGQIGDHNGNTVGEWFLHLGDDLEDRRFARR